MNKQLFICWILLLLSVSSIAQNTKSNPAYVDLGLPSGLLWADRNVGASSPEDYGYCFAWGETSVKKWGETSIKNIHDPSTNRYRKDDGKLTKYCTHSKYGYRGFTDGLTTLQPGDDAASYHIGGGARMPTEDEWQELLDNTTNQWLTSNGVSGRLFTSKKNGNSLFLPAAGYGYSIWDGSLVDAGSRGYYWSSSIYTNNSNFACFLEFGSEGTNMYVKNRDSEGLRVRPVKQKGVEQPQSVVNNQAKAPAKTEYLQGSWVDLGLPSGTKWKSTNEKGFYSYDEAIEKFGNRLPTKTQLDELEENCTWIWNSSKKGFKVVGPNGKSIFLPAAGYGDDKILGEGSEGGLWSSSSTGRYAFCLIFDSDGRFYSRYSKLYNSKLYIGIMNYLDRKFSIRLIQPQKMVNNQTQVPDKEYYNLADCWVDMGLPSGLLWADRNVGASSPEDYGYYFSWGETSTKSTYEPSTYRYIKDDGKLTKYCTYSKRGYRGFTDGLTILQSDDDAASYHFGDGARTPTDDEWQELLDNTTNKWTTRNGVSGRLFTSKKNGNSIFLPAAGYRWKDLLYETGSGGGGHYWSSSHGEEPYDAIYLLFYYSDDEYVGLFYHYLYQGYSVRPVKSKGEEQPQSIVNNQTQALEKAEYNLPDGWVDLGLPSGTKWKNTNEKGLYSYDEAVSKYGNSLPTKTQLEELKEKCQWKWDSDKKGFKVVGPNGSSIFLSAASRREFNGDVKDLIFEGKVIYQGYYWSYTPEGWGGAWHLYFRSGGAILDKCDRRYGFSVHLVQPQSIVNNQTQALEKAEYNLPDGWVDLGLPSGTKWKSTNENGYYSNDEAKQRFGINLPTNKQCKELIYKCTWTWIGDGYIVTGLNGNSIFLPAAGETGGWVDNPQGSSGFYWTATKDDYNYSSNFYFMVFYKDDINHKGAYTSIDHKSGERMSVRLVQP